MDAVPANLPLVNHDQSLVAGLIPKIQQASGVPVNQSQVLAPQEQPALTAPVPEPVIEAETLDSPTTIEEPAVVKPERSWFANFWRVFKGKATDAPSEEALAIFKERLLKQHPEGVLQARTN